MFGGHLDFLALKWMKIFKRGGRREKCFLKTKPNKKNLPFHEIVLNFLILNKREYFVFDVPKWKIWGIFINRQHGVSVYRRLACVVLFRLDPFCPRGEQVRW